MKRSLPRGHRRLELSQEEQWAVDMALAILDRKLGVGRRLSLTSPGAVKSWLALNLAAAEREEFWVLYLNTQNQLLSHECLFVGTLTQTSVYPREVVKGALARNAAAVIFAHNHPSGTAEPSRADELLTQALKQALAIIDVRVADHFIVGGCTVLSFAERGLL